MNNKYNMPIYRKETAMVYADLLITEQDYVLFPYIRIGQLREIEALYQTLENEKIPHTCLCLSETDPDILKGTDADYIFSETDFELKKIFERFCILDPHNIIKLCAMEPNSRDFFKILLGCESKIIDALTMSFGGISRGRIVDTRNCIEKDCILKIGTIGSFDEKHGAKEMGQMLPSVVKKIAEKQYKIMFNIKTHKNYQTNSNFDSYKKIKKLSGKYVFCTDNEVAFSAEEYFQYLKSQCVIFLPYSNFFKYVGSGVLCEAYELGKPVIVSAGTGLSRSIKAEQFDYLSKVEIKKGFKEKSVSAQMIVEGKEEQTLITADNLLNKQYGLLKMSSSVPGGRMRKETSVSIFIYELDKNGVCLRRREHLIESNDNREFMSLIKLMNETEKIIVKVSNADTIYAIDLFNIHILFSEDKDIRLGVIGLDFTTEEDLFDVIEEIYLNYDHYADTARAHGEKWSEEHSAEKMLDDWMKAE